MTVICVPEDDVTVLLGELPDDVRVIVWDGRGQAPDGVADVEFLVPTYGGAPFPKDALAAMPKLRVVQTLSAGVDVWHDRLPDGVALHNARGVHGPTTAELAVAGMLAVLRRIPEFVDRQRRHESTHLQGDSLADRRVLVVGPGDIGDRIAVAARVFDAQVTVVARTARDGVHAFEELPQLLPQADVVAIAVPLTESTRGMVDTEFLAALPDGALLVNVARGPVVDTDALLAELQSGRLRAYLDVVDPEPLPADHPLWDAPNVLLTPHVGGGTSGWQRRGYGLVGDQVRRFVAGQELVNRVEGDY